MGKPGSLALAAIVMMACVVSARILPAQQAVSDTETIATETIGPETIDPATDCSITMTAKAEPLAMAALTITAGCLPDEQIVLHHSGLMFSHKTNAAGVAKMTVPALTKKAIFVATFDNGDGALTMINVPDAGQFQRVSLQWQGAKGLQLHAYKDGATHGADGHLSLQTAPLDPDSTEMAGPFFTDHGITAVPDGFHAEIASFPVDLSGKSQPIKLGVEVEITDENCGRTVAGELVYHSADTHSKGQQLTLYLPKCDAIGDFIVMNAILDNFQTPKE